MQQVLIIISLFFIPHSLFAAKAPEKSLSQNLEQKLNRQADIIRKLKRQNIILKKQAKVLPSKKQLNKPEPSKSHLSKSQSEEALFASFYENFKKGDQKNYRKALYLLAKNYPNSSYFAQIYYMAGRSALKQSRFKTAIRSFNRVIEKQPDSKYALAAKYSKAITYQKMNLNSQAGNIFQSIIKESPNTKFAQRSMQQLKQKKL